MSCLTSSQLLRAALLGPAGAMAEHLRSCGVGAERWSEWRARVERLAAAEAVFEEGHVAGRERLLAALAVEGSERKISKEGNRMRKRMLVGVALAVLIVVAAGVAGLGLRPPSALAMAAKALRQVRSYQCRAMTTEDGEQVEGLIRWAAPGSVRLDVTRNGRPDETIIYPFNGRRMRIRHDVKRFDFPGARIVTVSPFLNLLGEVASYTGSADREFPEKRPGRSALRGFVIDMAKFDPKLHGTLRAWIDPDTNLPDKIELDMPNSPPATVTDFWWDVPIDGWFDLMPPAGYVDDTPIPLPPEQVARETLEAIRTAMQVWLRYCPGHYPPSITIRKKGNPYGDDSSLRELAKAAGVRWPLDRPDLSKPPYQDIDAVSRGVSRILVLLTWPKSDAAYHGDRVKPTDKDKVLFRWRLESGEFRVIYGDLRAETVSGTRLSELEQR